MSEPQETRKPNRFRITSIIIAIVMLGGAFGVLIGPFTINVSAAPDTHTWDGGGGDAAAGTHANWVSNIAPEAGDSIIFDAGALPCTWNLSFAVGSFTMAIGYSGTITMTVSFSVTSYSQAAGVFVMSTYLSLTDSGDFIKTGGTLTDPFLIMTGSGASLNLNAGAGFTGLTISGAVSLDGASFWMSSNVNPFSITPGGVFTLATGKVMSYVLQTNGALWSNLGVLDGSGTVSIESYDKSPTIIFGTIDAPVIIETKDTATANNTITLGAAASFGSTLTIESLDAVKTMTLDLSTNNYPLSATDITIGTRGAINGRASFISCSENWDSSAGFISGTSNLSMTGNSKIIETAGSGGGLYNLTIAGLIATESNLTISHDLTIDTGKILTLGSAKTLAIGNELINYGSINQVSDTSITDLFTAAYYTNVSSGGIYLGEASTIDTGTQIDLWSYGIYYTHTTDGITYAIPQRTNTSWDMQRPYVLKTSNTYYMYCSNLSDNGNFSLFTGTDKVNFTNQGIVLSIGASGWDNAGLGNMCVWKEGVNSWKMLYEGSGWGGTGYWCIGLATSTDGLTWTKYPGNPVLDAWNDYPDDHYYGGCGRPIIARTGSTVLKTDGLYHMWFHSMNTVNFNGIFRASSPDLMTWTIEGKQEGIILETPDLFTNWGDHSIVEFQGRTYLYYTPTNQSDRAHLNLVIDNHTLTELLSAPPTNLNGGSISINGTSATPFTGFGTFDGDLYLNGTAIDYQIQAGFPMGTLHTNKDTLVSLAVNPSLPMIWAVEASDPTVSITFTLSGLESGRMYRVYVDGVSSNLLTASGSGVISFTYSGPWSEHQFEIVATSITGSISPLVNLIFIMFGIGIVVGVIAEGTNSLRKMQMRTTEQMVKSLLNMVIYIVIGIASLGVLYSIVV
jgi:hypothetical protein